MSKHKPAHVKTEAERAAYNARKLREKKVRNNALAGTADLPDGHRIKGSSVLTDAGGNLSSRWDKTERDSTPEGEQPAVPPSFAVSKQSRFTDAQGKVRGMWTGYEQDKIEQAEAFKKAFTEFAEGYALRAPEIVYTGFADDDMRVLIPIGDPHVGMLAHVREAGATFDLRIAERELLAAVDLLISQAPAASSCSIVNLGDWFHAQDDSQLTPRGHNKQDVDGRLWKVIEISLSMCERMVERALAKYSEVRFTFIPGNHDPHLAMVFSLMLRRIFRDNPRITIPDTLDPFVIEVFGECLMLYNHTDKVKLADLVAIMAAHFPKAWGAARHRFVHGGHVHHSEVKEMLGAVGESHNTLAGSDAWHRAEGYGARRLLKAIGLHKLYGEVSRNTASLERVRAHIGAGR